MYGKCLLRVLFLSIVFLIGCQFDETIDQTNEIPVHISIVPLDENFLIGEAAYFSISIQNNQNIPIEFPVPLKFHLIAPNGEDIYPQPNLNDNEAQAKMITINPQRTTEFLFDIPFYVYSLQLGQYTLWVEADDTAGNSYRSNESIFNIIEKEYNVSSKNVNLAITSDPVYQLDDSWNFQAVFTNSSNEPLTFLKPQDGSFAGWVYPMYLFLVTDQDGNNLRSPGGDISGEPIYSANSMFTIESGQTYQFTDTFPIIPGMDRPGIYKIQLMYAVRDQEMFPFEEILTTGDVFQPERIEWDEDVFLGHIMSNEITITIEE